MPRKRATKKAARKRTPATPVRKRAAKKKPSLAARAKAVSRSTRTIGRKNVKRGPVLLGVTRRLTPTRQGFSALDGLLLQLQRSYGAGDVASYTFDMQVRFKGPDGTYVTAEFPRIGVPRVVDVRRRKKKGESDAAAFRRIVEFELRKAMFRAVEHQGGIGRGGYQQMLATVKGQSKTDVRKALQSFKDQRSLTFRLAVKRVFS